MQIRTSTRAPKATAEDGDDAASAGSHAASRRRRSTRTRVIGGLLLLVLLLGVVMMILAIPLVSARSKAKDAQAELEAAKTALTNDDFPTARVQIRAARADVDSADASLNGIGGDVWSSTPVFGGAVGDARHLVDALSQAVRVAEIGAHVYPMVSGTNGQLVQGERIDLGVLGKVVKSTARIGPHLKRAVNDLNQVSGTTPVIGGAIDRARDSASAQLVKVQDSYLKTEPLLKSMPALVGADGPRSYLLAMLNPSELRYSGGGALSFTTINFSNGNIYFGGTVNVDDILAKAGNLVRWKPVAGNPFHLKPEQRVTSSTFSPYWSVSGEELLRAFYQVYPQHLDGVIAVDLQALASLFAVTGPVDTGVKNVPPLTSDNLVQILAGSYGQYSTAERHRINAQLVPAFRQKFFEGGSISKKANALLSSAQGRHFATYFRDPTVQRRFAKVGLAGNLAATPNDYLGVFTQNLNGSKVDYWQHRTVTSRVQLHDDGSATVHLRVKVKNRAPAYTGPLPQPTSGYATRYLGATLGLFLPTGTHLGAATVNNRVFTPHLVTPSVKGVYNRPFFARHMMVPAGKTRVVKVTYRVPHAAVRTAGGGLAYNLAVDPQDTVVPEKLNVEVTWPPGYAPQSLPAGWNATSGQTASYSAPVTEQLSFSVPLAH